MATEAGFGGPQFASIATELQNVAFNFGAAAAAARELGAVIQTFRVFERELTLANAVAEGTAETFKRMEQQARKFALASKFSVTEVANSFYFLAAAGLSAEQSMSAAAGVLVLSQATMTELSRAADLVASSLASFGLAASESLRVSNLFVAAANSSLASLEKLEFAFRQVAPVAADAGLSIEQTVAALNQLFDAGLRGEQAGTALRNVLVRLINPVGNSEKILQKLGIATVDATGNLRGLQDILEELYKANVSQGTLSQIFGTEALAGATTLINSAGTGKLKKNLDEITGTQDAVLLAIKQMQTLDGAITRAANSLTELRLIFGDAFAGVVQTTLEGFNDFVRTLREIDPAILATIANIAGLATGFYLFYKALQFGGLFEFIGQLRALSVAAETAEAAIELAQRRMALFSTVAFTALGILGAVAAAVVYFAATVDDTNARLRAEEMFGPLDDAVVSAKRVKDALEDMFPKSEADGAVNRFNVLNGQISALGTSALESVKLIDKMADKLIELDGLKEETNFATTGLANPFASTKGQGSQLGFENPFAPTSGQGALISNPFNDPFANAKKNDIGGAVSSFAEQVNSLGEEDEAIKQAVTRLLKSGSVEGALAIAKDAKSSKLVELAKNLEEVLKSRAGATKTINSLLDNEAASKKDAFSLTGVGDLFSEKGLRSLSLEIKGGIAAAEANINEFTAQIEAYRAEVAGSMPAIEKELISGLETSKRDTDKILAVFIKDLQKNDPKLFQKTIQDAILTSAKGISSVSPELLKKNLTELAIAGPRTLTKANVDALIAAKTDLGGAIPAIDEASKQLQQQARSLAVEAARIGARITNDTVAAYEAEVDAIELETAAKTATAAEKAERIYRENYKGVNSLFKIPQIQSAILQGSIPQLDNQKKIIGELKLTQGKEEEFIDAIIDYLDKTTNYGELRLKTIRSTIKESVYGLASATMAEQTAIKTLNELLIAEQAKRQKEAVDQANTAMIALNQRVDAELEIAELQRLFAETNNLTTQTEIAQKQAELARNQEILELNAKLKIDLERAGTDEAQIARLKDANLKQRALADAKYNAAIAGISQTAAQSYRSLATERMSVERQLIDILQGVDFRQLDKFYEINPQFITEKYDYTLIKIADDIERSQIEFEQSLRSLSLNGRPLLSEDEIKAKVAEAAESFELLQSYLEIEAKRAMEAELDAFRTSRAGFVAEAAQILVDSYAQIAGALAASGQKVGTETSAFGGLALQQQAVAAQSEKFAGAMERLNQAFRQQIQDAGNNTEAIAGLNSAWEESKNALNFANEAILQYMQSAEFATTQQREFARLSNEMWINLKTGSDDFFGGFEAGLQKISLEMPQNFEIGVEASRMLMDGLGDAFASLFDGTAKDWKSMLANMLKQLAAFIARAVIMQAALKLFGLDSGGTLGGSGGGSGIGGPTGNIVPFIGASAQGNVLSSAGGNMFGQGGKRLQHPTIFDTNGKPMTTVLESGPEAVLPLKRGRDGNLGVYAEINAAASQGTTTSRSMGGNTYVVSPTFVNEFHTDGSVTSSQKGDQDDPNGMVKIMKNLNEGLTAKIVEEISRQMRPGGVIAQAAGPRF